MYEDAYLDQMYEDRIVGDIDYGYPDADDSDLLYEEDESDEPDNEEEWNHWDDDAHLAQWDDDPNPYHGDYSEM